MRPMVALGVACSEARVISAFVAAVGLLWAGSLLHGSWVVWTATAVAAVAVALIVVSWRRAPLATLLARSLPRRRPGNGPGADDLWALAPASDHRLRFTDSQTAIRAAGDDLVAVVAVDGPSHTPSVLDNHRVQSAATLPVGVVAEALCQFDIRLSGIDILSVGRRRAPKTHHHCASTYSGEIGAHPAVGRRRTVCVLRMNALDNVAAVARRDSLAATLAACAHRLAAELNAHRLGARVVNCAELADIDAMLGAGLGQRMQPRFGGVRHRDGWVSTYWVSPRDISTDTLSRVWAPDTDGTATALQLRSTPQGAVAVGLLVRYATAGQCKQPPLTGLNPLSGRHDLGVRAGLADAHRAAVAIPQRLLAGGEKLHAPIGASGIILGATSTGHPLLVDLADARAGHASTVTVAGEVALLVQLAMRSAAIGYQVLVVTSRPDRWRDATAAGLRVVAALPERLPEAGRGVMVVDDHVDDQLDAVGAGAAITLRTVTAGTASVADVHIEQDSTGTAVVRTADFQTRIRINVDAERNMINWPRRGAA
jgi:type VII secretion protein EccE